MMYIFDQWMIRIVYTSKYCEKFNDDNLVECAQNKYTSKIKPDQKQCIYIYIYGASKTRRTP